MRGFSTTVCLFYCYVAAQQQVGIDHAVPIAGAVSNHTVIKGSGRIAHQRVIRNSTEQIAGEADVPHILDGAIIPAKSGRIAHNDQGDEVGQDGVVLKKQTSFWGRLMSTLHLSSEDVEPASPTPKQPELVKSKRLYAEQTEPSFFAKLINKLSFGGSTEAEEAPEAYMDGISKPDWSLDRSN